MSTAPEATISIPSPVSALSLGPNDTLCVGSEDGSVRWYNLPSTKVIKAAKSLGAEIASIAWQLSKKNEPVAIWVASGRRAICMPADLQKMIATVDDASASVEIGQDEDDVLNELSIGENGKHLAFTSDSGCVGIVDLSSHAITRMKSRHNTVCGSVKFIPDRPSELVSGGYDSALLHFDTAQGTILSRLDISAPPPSEGISLSPPFVLSVTVNPAGLVAASTADGRVWVGGGGEKRPNSKKKRSRKWEGLREDEGFWLQVADGPVVSSTFGDSDRLFTCSLLGVITEYKVKRGEDETLQATKGWSVVAPTLEKVNAMAASQSRVVVGGFDKGGKGIVQIFQAT
ncbi:WD40 repeat-like protein [Polyporus arcularius HHB13444]|uniref:WD40 repeat-like protein n=1 Tax=Polyporus arcularius HHB13444 TaxID=1314778 RepID=A0A5C3PV48_9APHY|nr:WD40 repeat-like protein [Polyporus arcularius HHB13444]